MPALGPTAGRDNMNSKNGVPPLDRRLCVLLLLRTTTLPPKLDFCPRAMFVIPSDRGGNTDHGDL